MDKLKPKIVILLSGGVDSSTMALLYKNEGFDLYPLFVDYGQPSSKREWSSCESVCKFLKLSRGPKKFSVPFLSKLNKSTETQGFFPFRNAILVTLGALHGYSIGANAVALGIIGKGGVPFPDCSQEFIVSLSNTLSLSVNSSTKVFAPFLNFSKEEVLCYGMQSKFPYQITYSCYFAGTKHCGRCLSCLNRKQAFENLHVINPTRYEK